MSMVGIGLPAMASTSPDPKVVSELRGKTQALLDAIAPGDVKVWDRLLEADAIQVDENDVLRRKKEILADLKPLGPGLVGRLAIDDFHVVQHGDLAVVAHEDDEYLDYYGQVLRSRFRMTDTWIKTHEGWKEIGSQVLAVQKDPPAQTLSPGALCEYNGSYRLSADIVASMHCGNEELSFERPGRPARHFKAEVRDVFFEPGAPRTRRIFLRDTESHVTGFVDRREGRDILWRRVASDAP
jgi:hypothetical protein